MKTLVKLLLLSIILWLTPVTLFFFTLSSQSQNLVNQLKINLSQSNVYETLLTSVDTAITDASSESDTAELEKVVWPIVKREITPAYIQAKTEKLIDDAYAWATGTTDQPPVISFQDLKDSLIKKNKKQYDQLLRLSKQFKQEQANLVKEAESDPQLAKQIDELDAFDPEVFLTTDPIIPMDKHLGWLKRISVIVTRGTLILIGVELLIIILLTLPNSTARDRLRSLGITFAVAAAGTGLSFLIAASTIDLLKNLFPQASGNLAPYLEQFSLPLLTPLINIYITQAKTLALISSGLAVLCIVSSFKFSQIPPKSISK